MLVGSIPGSGFLPLWLSLAMAALSALLLFDGFRRPVSRDRGIAWPRGPGLLWIGATMAGLLVYTYLISILGYILSTFAFIGLLVWLLGSYRWYWSAGVGASAAMSLYLVFQVWLAMELPTGLLIIP